MPKVLISGENPLPYVVGYAVAKTESFLSDLAADNNVSLGDLVVRVGQVLLGRNETFVSSESAEQVIDSVVETVNEPKPQKKYKAHTARKAPWVKHRVVKAKRKRTLVSDQTSALMKVDKLGGLTGKEIAKKYGFSIAAVLRHTKGLTSQTLPPPVGEAVPALVATHQY